MARPLTKAAELVLAADEELGEIDGDEPSLSSRKSKSARSRRAKAQGARLSSPLTDVLKK